VGGRGKWRRRRARFYTSCSSLFVRFGSFVRSFEGGSLRSESPDVVVLFLGDILFVCLLCRW